jgi:hypothetical protein
MLRHYCFSIPLLAAVLCSTTLLAPVRPVGAAWDGPYLRGSYYGSLITSSGDYIPLALHLSTQNGRRIGGWMIRRHSAQDIPLTGTVSRSGRISLSGRGGSGAGAFHVRVRAAYEPGDDEATGTILGEYRLTGGENEAGSFSATGLRSGS